MAEQNREDEAAKRDDSKKTEEPDDLRARFPDPEADERLQIPHGNALPEVPQVRFERPQTRSPEAQKRDAGLERMAGELRGAGAASTIGITLVVCIFMGTGLGWLADHYLLGSPATPWGLIAGFILGTISGFVQVVRTASAINKDN